MRCPGSFFVDPEAGEVVFVAHDLAELFPVRESTIDGIMELVEMKPYVLWKCQEISRSTSCVLYHFVNDCGSLSVAVLPGCADDLRFREWADGKIELMISFRE